MWKDEWKWRLLVINYDNFNILILNSHKMKNDKIKILPVKDKIIKNGQKIIT